MKTLFVMVLAAGMGLAASVDLAWTAAPTNPANTQYNVYRAAGVCIATGQTFAKLNPAPLSVRVFNDSTVVNGNAYCYYATATNGTLESLPSPKASATIQLSAPPDFTITINIATVVTVNGQQIANGQKTITIPVVAGQ